MSEYAVNPTEVQTVMVVDNDADLRLLLSTVLDGAGVNVVTAAGGQEALDMVAVGHVPSLILTDLDMPGMNGSEFCDKLKQNLSTEMVPVILISGMEGIGATTLSVGAHGYLKKPYQIDKLTELVKAYLNES